MLLSGTFLLIVLSSLPTNLLFRFFYFFTCSAIQKSKSPKVFVQIADVSSSLGILGSSLGILSSFLGILSSSLRILSSFLGILSSSLRILSSFLGIPSPP